MCPGFSLPQAALHIILDEGVVVSINRWIDSSRLKSSHGSQNLSAWTDFASIGRIYFSENAIVSV